MATPQELLKETKTRLDLNVAKLKLLQKEIKEKQNEVNQLTQPILEDQGAVKQLEKLCNVEEPTKAK